MEEAGEAVEDSADSCEKVSRQLCLLSPGASECHIDCYHCVCYNGCDTATVHVTVTVDYNPVCFPISLASSEDSSQLPAAPPREFPVFLWQPFLRHGYFCFAEATAQRRFSATLRDCIRRLNHGMPAPCRAAGRPWGLQDEPTPCEVCSEQELGGKGAGHLAGCVNPGTSGLQA